MTTVQANKIIKNFNPETSESIVDGFAYRVTQRDIDTFKNWVKSGVKSFSDFYFNRK